jgi:hypothetical protein
MMSVRHCSMSCVIGSDYEFEIMWTKAVMVQFKLIFRIFFIRKLRIITKDMRYLSRDSTQELLTKNQRPNRLKHFARWKASYEWVWWRADCQKLQEAELFSPLSRYSLLFLLCCFIQFQITSVIYRLQLRFTVNPKLLYSLYNKRTVNVCVVHLVVFLPEEPSEPIVISLLAALPPSNICFRLPFYFKWLNLFCRPMTYISKRLFALNRYWDKYTDIKTKSICALV